MEKYNLWNENFRIYKEIDMEYHKLAVYYNLSDSEFFILNSIYTSDSSISQQDIIKEWTYSKQTINSSIKNLIKKGLLKIEIDSQNKRRKIIKLTIDGEKIVNKIMPNFNKIENLTFGKIPDDLIISYNKSLRKALEYFKTETSKIYEEEQK